MMPHLPPFDFSSNPYKADAAIHAVLSAQDDQALCLCRDQAERLASIVVGGHPLDNDGDWELVMAAARLGLNFIEPPATPGRVLHGTNILPPLVSTGQGDSRRDYRPAPAPNPFLQRRRRGWSLVWLILLVGVVVPVAVGLGIAALIDWLLS